MTSTITEVNADGIAGRFAGEHTTNKIFVRRELYFLPGHHAHFLSGISKNALSAGQGYNLVPAA